VSDVYRTLGLTSLARLLPTLLDQARQSQPSYEQFLQEAVGKCAALCRRAWARAARAATSVPNASWRNCS